MHLCLSMCAIFVSLWHTRFGSFCVSLFNFAESGVSLFPSVSLVLLFVAFCCSVLLSGVLSFVTPCVFLCVSLAVPLRFLSVCSPSLFLHGSLRLSFVTAPSPPALRIFPSVSQASRHARSLITRRLPTTDSHPAASTTCRPSAVTLLHVQELGRDAAHLAWLTDDSESVEWKEGRWGSGDG